jgi:hypothetical protein
MNGYMSTTPTIPMTTAQRKNASMPCSCHRRIPAWRLQTRQKRLGPSDIKRHERLIDDGWLGGTNRFRLIPDPWRVDKGINKRGSSGMAHLTTHNPAIASRLASHAVHVQNWYLRNGTSQSKTQTSRPILYPPLFEKRPDGYISPQTR